MTFSVFDSILGGFSLVLGSTALLVILGVMVFMILLWKADVPAYLFFLLLAPFIIAIAQTGGLAPAYLWSGAIMILGVLLAVAFIKLFR